MTDLDTVRRAPSPPATTDANGRGPTQEFALPPLDGGEPDQDGLANPLRAGLQLDRVPTRA